MRQKFLALAHILATPAVAVGGSLLIAAVAIGITWYSTRISPSGAYTAATMAPITEEVDVSGPVQSSQQTNLSFQVSGAIAAIEVKVGQHVGAGATLLALSGGSQAAAVKSAKANLEAAQANLSQITAGTRPEQLSIDQNAAAQAEIALRNAVRSAYVSADTAVHADADPLFLNPRNAGANLTLVVPDAALVNTINQERVALEPVLSAWNQAVSAGSFDTSDPSSAATLSSADLTQVTVFLDNLAAALAEAPTSSALSATQLASYQAVIAGARTSVAAASAALTSAGSALIGAQGTLALAQAGSTPQAIAVGQAQVDAAEAAVEAAQVSAGQTVLFAPISGTITAQNANPGEVVAPGVVLVSMESDAAYEAKASVSEADIAKLKVGESVNATFDAYPGATFPAAITAVDPAATIENGVASYEVTATFAQNDPRIASGLTAHLSIITASAPSALIIPASAVIADASGGLFVYAKGPSGDVKTPVTTGVRSAAGMVQILSGLSAGQEVLTFGNQE